MKEVQLFIITILFTLCSNTIGAQRIFELMEIDGVNLKEVQDEAAIYFAEVGIGKGTGYKLFKRWEYHATLNLQDDGTILSKETNTAAIRSSKKTTSRSAKTISLSNWTELGPLAMERGNGNSPGIGRITSIYVEPVNQQLIYVGSPGGGLWKSTNAGSSWTPLGDQFENMSIWAIEADPTNSNIIYIGNSTGELFKSTNGGLSFTELFNESGVLRDILINPNNTNDLYVTVVNDGLYHTTNGGSSWTKVISADIEDVMFKPGSTTTVYACGDDFYRSTNSGSSFTQITNGILDSARMKLAVSSDNGNYVYIVQKSSSISGFGYLYRSTNSGVNFTAQSVRSDIDYIGVQAGRDMAITISDTNSNEVHIGGLHMYKSIDGGVSFTRETTGSYGEASNSASLSYLHADIEVMQYIDGNMYVGCDGGIYKSTDAGVSFTDLSTGLGIQQFYRISNSATNKDVVIGGSQDNGSAIKSGSSHQWMQFGGGDGMDCMVDHNNENIIYGSSQNGNLIKSINGGVSTLTPTSFIRPPENGSGVWTTPLGMDPNNSSRIYAGYTNLYRHDNAGISGDWVNASSNITFSSKLNYIETCPSNSDAIYVATTSSIYKSTNITTASPAWTQIALPTGKGSIIDIAVDTYDENRVGYVTSTGYVLLSSDGGSSWEEIDDGLPNTSIKTIVFDRSHDKGIYVAIDGVVYFKSNTVTDWTVFSDNLPNVAIRELELYYDKEAEADSRIRVATYGRGLWESYLYNDEDSEGNTCSGAEINAYNTIQAEDFCDDLGVKTGNGNTTVGYIQDGDYIRFNNVAFGTTGAVSFQAIVSSDTPGGNIEIHLDNPGGALAGTCTVNNTGGWTTWDVASCDINEATGNHDVYLVFTGGNGYLLDIDSFQFIEGSTIFPDPNKKYYIDSPHHNLRIAADGILDERPSTVSINTTGSEVEWKFVDKGNGYWHIDLALAGATKPRLRSISGEYADMQETSSSGNWTYYDLEPGVFPETYFLTLPAGPTGFKRLQVDSNGDVKMVDISHAGTWESFLFTEAGPLSENKNSTDLESELSKISLFPNPVSTTLHIQLPTDGEETVISISNLLGEMLVTNTFDTHEGLNLLKVNIEGFAPGLYTVTILRAQTKLVKKIVVEE